MGATFHSNIISSLLQHKPGEPRKTVLSILVMTWGLKKKNSMKIYYQCGMHKSFFKIWPLLWLLWVMFGWDARNQWNMRPGAEVLISLRSLDSGVDSSPVLDNDHLIVFESTVKWKGRDSLTWILRGCLEGLQRLPEEDAAWWALKQGLIDSTAAWWISLKREAWRTLAERNGRKHKWLVRKS